MRIQNLSSPREIDKNRKKALPVRNIVSSLFSSELKNQEEEISSYRDDVELLRTEIDVVGKQLGKEPTLPNFKKYRDLLSRLARLVSNEAYRLEKTGGTPQNPRYFETITIIDREADALYNLIVKENRDHIAVIAKVIGIKGLVVDLLT